jgi:flagellar biosynthetic protein FliP
MTTAHRPVRAHRPWRTLAGHYAEMLVAMFAGMVLLGGLRDLAGLTVSFESSPSLSYLLMATDMALGMGAWMLVRGHGPRHTLEMCAAMYVPLLLVPLVWLEVLGPMPFMIVAHAVMMVAMLVVLVRQHPGEEPGCPT